MNLSSLRTRWAAVGAAVAVSLGAGGISMTSALTDAGEKPIYVPIEPCRLLDTRANQGIGGRTTPLSGNEQLTLSGWGAQGDCTLPTGVTGLGLNVTALGATLPTYLAFFPADATEVPTASNLNPVPGAPATPNAVTVDLDAAGNFKIYNLQGNVNVIVDVVGYYDDHTHDDRYYTETEIDTALDAKVDQSELLFATVDASGTLVYGRGVVSVSVISTSFTLVKFNRNIVGECAATAQIGTTSGSEVVGGNIDISYEAADTVGLDIEDYNGNNVQKPFHLIVAC